MKSSNKEPLQQQQLTWMTVVSPSKAGMRCAAVMMMRAELRRSAWGKSMLPRGTGAGAGWYTPSASSLRS
jgi:hypothetical protein